MKGWYRLILNAFGTKIKRKIIGTYIWGSPINFPPSTVYSSPPHSKQKPAKFSLLGIMHAHKYWKQHFVRLTTTPDKRPWTKTMKGSTGQHGYHNRENLASFTFVEVGNI